MLLDEPTANLDVKYQMLVMRMLKDITRVKNIMVIVICHDLNVTSIYADRIIMLNQGKVFADGTAEEVLTKENIYTVYGVESDVSIAHGKVHINLLDTDILDSHLEERFAEMEKEFNE